jgi:DNA-binding transcriptional LysR family regulator
MQTIVALVASGLGVSLVPESASALGLRGVAYRPIAGRPMTGLVLVRRSGATDPAVAAFREIAIGSQG